MKITTKNHEEWLQQRTLGIGASEVGTIMDVNEYQTLYQLWLRKKHPSLEEESNEAMLWGHLLEDAVAQRYAIATGAQIVKASAQEIMYVKDDKPFMRISPDRLFYPAGAKKTKNNLFLLECKTSLIPIDEKAIPLSYMCQVQYQMYVSGIHKAVLAWMNLSNRTFGYKNIPYNPEFCETMAKHVEDFWNRYVIGDEEPDATTVKDAQMKWPKSIEGTQMIASQDLELKSRELASIRAEIKLRESDPDYKALKDRETQLTDEIKVAMTDHENLVAENGQLLFTYKSAKDKTVFDDIKAVEADPDLKKYYITKPGTRSLLLKLKS